MTERTGGACADAAAELRRAVARLYEALAVYPLRDRIPFCPCCGSQSEEAGLHEVPLRELSPSLLAPYARGAAWGTWGTLADFKHFLPRLLELLAWEDLAGHGWPDAGDLFKRLRSFDGVRDPSWETWPESERQAVGNYLDALWRFVTVHHDPVLASVWDESEARSCPDQHYRYQAGAVLDWLVQAASDVTPYVRALVRAPEEPALRNLIELIDWYAEADALDRDRPVQVDQIRGSLASASTAARLWAAASSAEASPALAGAARRAVGVSRSLRPRGGEAQG